MVTESSSAVVPPEVIQNIDTLNGQVENLQRELTQAFEVWQTTIADEKKRFEDLLEHKGLAFQEQDGQWARQKEAFEERLVEIKSEFESRLIQTEQNATRALSELDDAWQRDKLEWGPGAQAKWPAERRELEDKIQSLEEELAQLRREHVVQTSAGPTPETVKALQAQLLDFQQAVASLQDRASRSDELVSACVQALDYQISVLYDLVQHAISPSPSEDANLAQS
jgi:chromosome segregation ATPase